MFLLHYLSQDLESQEWRPRVSLVPDHDMFDITVKVESYHHAPCLITHIQYMTEETFPGQQKIDFLFKARRLIESNHDSIKEKHMDFIAQGRDMIDDHTLDVHRWVIQVNSAFREHIAHACESFWEEEFKPLLKVSSN